MNCNCQFDYHCELGMECGCGACLANDAFLRLKTWEEQKEAFSGIAARLGQKICPFLSTLDYSPAGSSEEVSSAEWNRIVTGNEVTEDGEQWEPTTIGDVLSLISALDDDDKEAAWENINTFMHHVVEDEQNWAEKLASRSAKNNS
jgi:hypothetical protein